MFCQMQAENTMDRMDWIEKITGVIASLLSSQLPDQVRTICSMQQMQYILEQLHVKFHNYILRLMP